MRPAKKKMVGAPYAMCAHQTALVPLDGCNYDDNWGREAQAVGMIVLIDHGTRRDLLRFGIACVMAMCRGWGPWWEHGFRNSAVERDRGPY